jgi:hypothetical protein
MAVTMKNAIFLDVMPYGSLKEPMFQRNVGSYESHMA